jgi:hypothetical protein
MPGVDRECITHHDACDCREAARREKEQQLQARVAQLEAVLRRVRPFADSYSYRMSLSIGEYQDTDSMAYRLTQEIDAALSAPPSPLVEVARAAVAWRLAQAFSGYEPQPITRLVDTVDDMMRQQPGVWE